MQLAEAKALTQGQIIYHKTQTNADGTPMRAKVTSVKTWKRQPDRVEIHFKHGLYDYGYFTESELDQITTACWNCGKPIINPSDHYPINATIFCKEAKA